jgi:hypothetical protein
LTVWEFVGSGPHDEAGSLQSQYETEVVGDAAGGAVVGAGVDLSRRMQTWQ